MYRSKNCIKFFSHFRTPHFLNLLPSFWSSDMFCSDTRSSQNKPLIFLPSEIIHFFNSRKKILQQFHVHSSCQEFKNVWVFFPDCYGNSAADAVPVPELLLLRIPAPGRAGSILAPQQSWHPGQAGAR